MKHILKDIWMAHLDADPIERNQERWAVSKRLVQYEDILRGQLTEEQKTVLQEYDSCLHEINVISEIEAFSFGCRFTLQFLLALMQEK